MVTVTRPARPRREFLHERAAGRRVTLDDPLDPQVGAVEERPFVQDEEFVREDEFTCIRCHLIVPREEMAERSRRVCTSCVARELERETGALC